MTATDIFGAIEKYKLITIIRGVPSQKLIPLVEALYNGGIRLVEVTYSADGKVSDIDTAKNIASLVKHFGDKMYIGAGTVLTTEQVRLTKEAGGTFIISPDTCEEVIKETVRLGMVSMPGAYTPTEIHTAHKYGADYVKVFPAATLGADYIKAVKAPLCHIKYLAVGGIDLNNMEEYLNAGACGFGLSSNIIDKNMVAENNFDGITSLAKKYTAVIEKWQNI